MLHHLARNHTGSKTSWMRAFLASYHAGRFGHGVGDDEKGCGLEIISTPTDKESAGDREEAEQ